MAAPFYYVNQSRGTWLAWQLFPSPATLLHALSDFNAITSEIPAAVCPASLDAQDVYVRNVMNHSGRVLTRPDFFHVLNPVK